MLNGNVIITAIVLERRSISFIIILIQQSFKLLYQDK